jgi:hypothetical protein
MPYKPPYTIPEVLRLNADGLPNSEIAARLGISTTRVWQLVKQEQQRYQAAERAVVIRREISDSHTIDGKLSLSDLFCILILPKKHQRVLMAHFAERGIIEFSLRDMMDLLIPVIAVSNDLYDHMPAYRVRKLGVIIYADIIKAMSAVDCGEACQAEWAARKDMLREYLVRTKGFHYYVLHGKEAALAVHQPIP